VTKHVGGVDPPSEYFAAEMTLEQTSDRQQRFAGVLTGPLSPTLAFSLSMRYLR